MARSDIIREAFHRYVMGEITLCQLLGVIREWRR